MPTVHEVEVSAQVPLAQTEEEEAMDSDSSRQRLSRSTQQQQHLTLKPIGREMLFNGLVERMI